MVHIEEKCGNPQKSKIIIEHAWRMRYTHIEEKCGNPQKCEIERLWYGD